MRRRTWADLADLPPTRADLRPHGNRLNADEFERSVPSATSLGRVRSHHRVFIVAAAVAATSCSLLPPGNPVDFCVEQARAFCDLEFRCCTAFERQNDPFDLLGGPAVRRHAPSSAGECVDLMIEICQAGAAQQNESLVEERIQYDADEAVDCLEDLRKAADECNPATFFEASGTYLSGLLHTGQPGVLGDSCENALEGVVESGDECFASYECETGACVTQPGPNEVTAEGECAGDTRPENPFEQNIDFEICDGLGDEA